jgi:hypothetical protein
MFFTASPAVQSGLVIVPSDDGAGGTFTPNPIMLGVGQTVASFTYTSSYISTTITLSFVLQGADAAAYTAPGDINLWNHIVCSPGDGQPEKCSSLPGCAPYSIDNMCYNADAAECMNGLVTTNNGQRTTLAQECPSRTQCSQYNDLCWPSNQEPFSNLSLAIAQDAPGYLTYLITNTGDVSFYMLDIYKKMSNVDIPWTPNTPLSGFTCENGVRVTTAGYLFVPNATYTCVYTGNGVGLRYTYDRLFFPIDTLVTFSVGGYDVKNVNNKFIYGEQTHLVHASQCLNLMNETACLGNPATNCKWDYQSRQCTDIGCSDPLIGRFGCDVDAVNTSHKVDGECYKGPT